MTQGIRWESARRKIFAAVAVLVLSIGLAGNTLALGSVEAAKPDGVGQQNSFDTEITSLRGSTWG